MPSPNSFGKKYTQQWLENQDVKNNVYLAQASFSFYLGSPIDY